MVYPSSLAAFTGSGPSTRLLTFDYTHYYLLLTNAKIFAARFNQLRSLTQPTLTQSFSTNHYKASPANHLRLMQFCTDLPKSDISCLSE